MPHQNTQSTKATAQNAAAGYEPASEQAREQHVTARPEPRSYVAPDVADASLALPGAGEVSDYMDEGDPSYGAHQGANNTNRELHAHSPGERQGVKTRTANKDQFSRRSPGRGGT